MKYSLVISNFLEDIFSLSYSIVFLYFFALITEEGFLFFSPLGKYFILFLFFWSHDIIYMWNQKNDTNKLISRTKIDSQT